MPSVRADCYTRDMPIVGHGIDIVETARIKALVENHGGHFLERVFTPAEQQYCALSPKRYFEHLGTGWRGGIAWTDVEVVKERSGQPKIVLTGECLRIARELGIARWHVSISHIETHATASAIGLAAKDEG